MKDPLGVSPGKGNQGTTRGKEKILLTSVGIEPTTSGFDLPLLCRLSYKVGQRKSRTIYIVFIVLRGTTFICTLFAAIHRLYRPRLSLSDLVAQSAE